MTDPRIVVHRLLGQVDWQTETHGYVRCPGESLHNSRTGKKDCQVHIDGAPTVSCFHASCIGAVQQANKTLRRELGQSHWELVLPGGRVLRSGDVLHTSGAVIPKQVIEERAAKNGVAKNEALILASIANQARIMAPDIQEKFSWPVADIVDSSPQETTGLEPIEQFRMWLTVWPEHCTIWTGDTTSTGQPRHSEHFKPINEWLDAAPMGNFTCGASFKPGSYSRCNANLNGHRFLVVESDVLTKDQMGAVFAYLNQKRQLTLYCIVDTGGKSLHGWFRKPKDARMERELKALLTALQCDPKLFTYSQPVRVPGAMRDGKVQRLLWLRNWMQWR
jgi:hypothetical protein